jgi:uncharacterized membrane protein YedE/YeeE
MSITLFEGSAVVTALAVGFALKYGGLCTYAAALQMVRQGRYERLGAFLGAAAATTLGILPLAWWLSHHLQLPATHLHWNMMLLGGALVGLGAWLNRGCFFGTFVQLVSGNLTYLATLAGVVAGALLARSGLVHSLPATHRSALAAFPGGIAYLWLVLAALLLTAVVTRGNKRGRLVLALLGLGGGWLYAAVPGWSLSSVLTGSAFHRLGLQDTPPGSLALHCTLAMLAGGFLAAWKLGSFRLQWPKAGALLASLGGGTLMGLGAALVPGGNDGMLLHGIPALAPHSVTGYLMMLVTMVVLMRWLPNEKGFRLPGRG